MWRAPFLGFLIVVACGSDDTGDGDAGGGAGVVESKACDEARARFEECGIMGDAKPPTPCTGSKVCVAECVKKAECETLTGENITEEYEACLMACGS